VETRILAMGRKGELYKLNSLQRVAPSAPLTELYEDALYVCARSTSRRFPSLWIIALMNF
jgi:hypothetical protein